MRANIDDGDIFIGEFDNGAIGSVQTSFVTVGNYPGHRGARLRQRGRADRRLVEEFGVAETLKGAKPDEVEFIDIAVPHAFYPEGGTPRESWRTLFYANLISELRRRDPRRRRPATRATSPTAPGCKR